MPPESDGLSEIVRTVSNTIGRNGNDDELDQTTPVLVLVIIYFCV